MKKKGFGLFVLLFLIAYSVAAVGSKQGNPLFEYSSYLFALGITFFNIKTFSQK